VFQGSIGKSDGMTEAMLNDMGTQVEMTSRVCGKEGAQDGNNICAQFAAADSP
jgi:hypothetical protein